MARPLEDLEVKFWRKVEKNPGCWRWKASKFRRGYGQISHAGKNLKGHRVSFELHFGPIPDGMLVCHKCDNPECTNPKHLFLGTWKDNVQDMQRKGRRTLLIGRKNPMTKLTDEQIAEVRRSYIPGKVSQRVIAERFNITQGYVSEIMTGRKRGAHA